MSRPAIVVENLTKVYRIGQAERRSDTLVGAAVSALKAPVRNFRNLYRLGTAGRDESIDTIRAVDDVSFEVQPGEVLGVIGRNGAGKSTLLKILSRITKPTSGRVRMRGRVSSLLEVGTGFHPELTGRENVYLNGTILGMTRREIDRKFDEIVDFSGVEKFLDTPVKRYSSGMKVRLAFAVAAHLEPEILIIDEVLAVGDQEFQNKCLGKMREVAGGGGRTVLFVSHNMAAVSQLCDRCILLRAGGLRFDGTPEEAIESYLDLRGRSSGLARFDVANHHYRGERGGRVTQVLLRNREGWPTSLIGIGDSIDVMIDVFFDAPVKKVAIGVEIFSPLDAPLLNLRTDSQGLDFGPYKDGDLVTFTVSIPSLPFYPGVYRLTPWIGVRDGKRIDHIREGIELSIVSRGRFQAERQIQANRGIVMMDCEWSDSTAKATR